MKKRTINWKLIGLVAAFFLAGLGAGAFTTSAFTTCYCNFPQLLQFLDNS